MKNVNKYNAIMKMPYNLRNIVCQGIIQIKMPLLTVYMKTHVIFPIAIYLFCRIGALFNYRSMQRSRI